MTKTINIGMNWEQAIPLLCTVIEHGTPQGKAAAKEELMRLARAVDAAQVQPEPESEPLALLPLVLGGKYRTRDGQVVHLTENDGNPSFPWDGTVIEGSDEGHTECFNDCGRVYFACEHEFDLVARIS